MSALVPTTEPTNLADAARTVARLDVLERVVKARREDLRDGPLFALACEAADLTGSAGFTGRIDGLGQVILTAPKPNVRVSDVNAFGGWLEQWYPDEVTWRPTVKVLDPVVVASIVEAAPMNPDGAMWSALSAALDITDRAYVSDDAVERLEKDGAIKVTEDAVYSTADGEPVPGLSVSVQSQRVSVRVDKAAREVVTGQVREALGMDGGA